MEFVTVGGASPTFYPGLGTMAPGAGLAPAAYAAPVAGGVYNLQGAQGAQALAPPAGTVPATSFTLPPAGSPAAVPTAAPAPAPAPATARGGGDAPAPAAAPAPSAGVAAPTATPGPSPAPASAPAPTDGAQAAQKEYTVKRGDSLSKIGAAHGVKWQELYELNKDVVGKNPNLIRPGQVLKIPSRPGAGAAAPAAGNRAGATPGTPASAAGGGPAQPDVPQLKQQLAQVQGQIAEGNRLVTQFYGQLQLTTSAEARSTIQQGIDQTLRDNEALEQLRRYLIQQLGPAAPPANTSVASQLAAL